MPKKVFQFVKQTALFMLTAVMILALFPDMTTKQFWMFWLSLTALVGIMMHELGKKNKLIESISNDLFEIKKFLGVKVGDSEEFHTEYQLLEHYKNRLTEKIFWEFRSEKEIEEFIKLIEKSVNLGVEFRAIVKHEFERKAQGISHLKDIATGLYNRDIEPSSYYKEQLETAEKESAAQGKIRGQAIERELYREYLIIKRCYRRLKAKEKDLIGEDWSPSMETLGI